MLIATSLLVALAVVIGVLLARAADSLAPDDNPDVERVNAVLPQTQCGQCGYSGCRPYAVALVAGEAPLDRCPPGGILTRRALSALLENPGTPAVPRGTGLAGVVPRPPVARIREADCVGCARCIEVCPVDAIVGAARFTHTVIGTDCTGCELCLPACPVDCIDLVAGDGP
ncbi:MAG: RnfABCDGE type electron transport complex subunit B [Gammaproteobacteria bacterium]|nr:RnfABCDGE type electron transport complex subunit B [Gammaproteobacteria bacterium]